MHLDLIQRKQPCSSVPTVMLHNRLQFADEDIGICGGQAEGVCLLVMQGGLDLVPSR